MMARFQQSCVCAAPPSLPGGGDGDLAATPDPAGSSVLQREAAADCDDAGDAGQSLPDAPSGQVDAGCSTARPAVSFDSLRQVEAEGLTPAMPCDSQQPEEAEKPEKAGDGPALEEAMLRVARLATCSDDEEFAVLDLGAASDASSDCSFERERTAAVEREAVFTAPR
jgi:hypothetical protein